MRTWDIVQRLEGEYFDYQKLCHILEGDSHIRRKIGQLIRDGVLVGVKKGLYILGKKIKGATYSREVLANLIYGPSYVSLEYALSFHGLIPEKVSVVTSVTTKRKKEFSTPVGTFTYEHLHHKAFPWGILRGEEGRKIGYLIASPEKALLDYLALRIKLTGSEKVNFEELVHHDLRIDEDLFNALNFEKIVQMGQYYKSPLVKAFGEFCKERIIKNG